METKNENAANNDVDPSKTDKENSNFETPPQTEIGNDQAANVGAIGASLLDAMPEVQDHAIEQEQARQAEISDAYKGLVDKNGTEFDPSIHKTKKDGSPTISKTGKLMLKPNASKPSENSTKTASASTTQNASQVSENSEKTEMSEGDQQRCTALGKVSANMIFACGRMLGGEEWQPIRQKGYDEVAAMEQAFADYYIASGKSEMSAGTALTMAIGSYALPRFTMPKTKEKIKKYSTKAIVWWKTRKTKKEDAARKEAEKIRKDSEKKEAE